MAAVAIACALMGCAYFFPRDPALEQQIAAIQEASARDRMALMEYTWEEQEIVSIKDKVQTERMFQVDLGGDGKIRRMASGLPQENDSQGREMRGFGGWMAQKKKRAAIIYGQDVKELAAAYAQMDTDLLRSAYERGDVTAENASKHPGMKQLSVENYIKPGDHVTLLVETESSAVRTLEASSYLTGTREPVTIVVEFSKSGGEPVHVDTIRAMAAKRHLSVSVRNLSYQRTKLHVNR